MIQYRLANISFLTLMVSQGLSSTCANSYILGGHGGRPYQQSRSLPLILIHLRYLQPHTAGVLALTYLLG